MRKHLVSSFVFLFVSTFATQAWFAQRFAVRLQDEPDGRVYLAFAHNLLAHGIYSCDETPNPEPSYLRLPGYPWTLAGVFALRGDANLAAVRVFQAFLATLVCAGVASLAFFWEPDPARKTRAATVAFVLAALCPFTAIYSAVIQAEMLTLFLSVAMLLAATWAFRARKRPQATLRWATAGLLAGAMQLVRPESGLFAAAVGLTLAGGALFARNGERWTARLPAVVRNGAVFSGVFVLTLVPWTWRNARVFHRFAPLPPANAVLPGEMDFHGFNAWYRTWADSEWSLETYYWGMTDGEPTDTDELPSRAFDSGEERKRTEELFERYNTLPTPDAPGAKPIGLTPELDEEFGRLAQERVARAPWRYHLWLPLRRAVNLWFCPHATYYSFNKPMFAEPEDRPWYEPRIWPTAFFALLCAYTVAASAGLWRLAKGSGDARRWAWLAVLIVVPRWAYLATLENTEPRYMVEIFPLVCVLGGIGLAARRRSGQGGDAPAA